MKARLWSEGYGEEIVELAQIEESKRLNALACLPDEIDALDS